MHLYRREQGTPVTTPRGVSNRVSAAASLEVGPSDEIFFDTFSSRAGSQRSSVTSLQLTGIRAGEDVRARSWAEEAGSFADLPSSRAPAQTPESELHTTLTSHARPPRVSDRSSPSRGPGLQNRLSSFLDKHALDDHPAVQELQVIQQKLIDEHQLEVKDWVNTTSGNMFFGILILLSSALVGIDVELYGNLPASPAHMIVIESIFLALFWVEIALRIRADGCTFFVRMWGIFDISCTFIGSLDAWVLMPLFGGSSALSGLQVIRTFRLLRLLRLLRIFRTFRGLARLALILGNSMQAMLWLGILLVIFIYISSVFTFTLLKDRPDRGEELTRATENILYTMYHHLLLLTGEGYTKVWVNPTWEMSGWWLFYWVAVVIWLHVFMLNLMVGVLVQQTLGIQKSEEEILANLAVESAQFHETIHTLFSHNDMDADGMLNAKELNSLLDGKGLDKILKAFNVKTDVPRSFLLQVFDLTHNNEITFDEFYETCIRLCGSNQDIRSFMLQVDVAQLKADISNHAMHIRRSLPDVAAQLQEPQPSRPEGSNLRGLLLLAHERMETLEQQQDAILAALRALHDPPAA